jgi:succinate-semialdehyde dehydrogenase/glutarate-semialdehyde dehydrogenase
VGTRRRARDAEGAIASKYRNTGQTCVCANRFLVQAPVYDDFAARLGRAVDTLKVGPGFDEGVSQGPLSDMAAVEKVESHIRDAVSKGATVAKGGRRHAAGGRFFMPTVLAGVTPEMQIAREETFGPVAPLFRFETEAEAIGLANATEFGLASYFYGRDIGRVWRVAEALEYGIVGVNTELISTELAPFGGMKESGIGREGSKYGIEEFLESNAIALSRGTLDRAGAVGSSALDLTPVRRNSNSANRVSAQQAGKMPRHRDVLRGGASFPGCHSSVRI